MKKSLLFLSIIILLMSTAIGQTVSKRLSSDIVKVSNGKFEATNYKLVSPMNSFPKQIKTYAVAPSDGTISRDNFVSIFTIMSNEIISGFFDEGFDSKDLDELIGNPDIVLNFFMTKSGIQMEITSEGETTRITSTWEDFFE